VVLGILSSLSVVLTRWEPRGDVLSISSSLRA
jgi:hypothetical protein